MVTLQRLVPTRNAFSLVAMLAAAAAVLSFARDALFGRAFGVTSVADAFFVGFVAMNTALLVLASGALSAAVPPVLYDPSPPMTRFGRRERAGALVTLSLGPLALTTLILVVTAPMLVRVLAPGLAAGDAQLAATLLRVLAPSVLFAGLGQVAARILQADERFGVPGLANLVSLLPAVALLALPAAISLRVPVNTVALAMTTGAALQLLLTFMAMTGRVILPSIAALSAIAPRVWRVAAPVLLYSVLTYFNVLWERGVASTLGSGTIAEFGYATRLFGLLVTFALTPLSIVFFPRYSSLSSSNKTASASTYLNRWLARAAVLGGLATACFIGAGYPLVAVIYGRGHFQGPAIAATSTLLSVYALGALPTSVTSLLITALYARVAWVAAVAAAIDSLLYPVASIILARLAGPIGLASARVVSFWALLGVAGWLGRRQLRLDYRRLLPLIVVCALAAGMGAGAALGMDRLFGFGATPSLVALFVQGLVSAGAYGLVLFVPWMLIRRRTLTKTLVGIRSEPGSAIRDL